jgi:RND family efflux transporter MFP subunit
VRVIEAPRVKVVPRALGYGEAQPRSVWKAVAEVSGRIVHVADDLKSGSLFSKDALLLRIDPAAYKLALAQAEAKVRDIQAQMEELRLSETNHQASLEIERRALALAEKELDRKRKLLEREVIAESAYEQEERAVLGQRAKVQSLQNSLALMPARRQVLEAQLAVAQNQVQDAQLDLNRTAIKAPFDMRLSDVPVEKTQFVQRGQVLLIADGTAVTEVAAQFPMERFMQVMKGAFEVPPPGERALRRLADEAGVSATVRYKPGDVEIAWDARLVRIDSVIDPKTRTLSVIVAVDKPYEKVEVGVRPPLVKGMYCEVEVRGRPRPDRLIVPQDALHGAKGQRTVYVVGKDDRLERRSVTVEFEQPDFAVIGAGLSPGERVVLTDLVSAIPGTLLDPTPDPDAVRALVAKAAAQAPAR